MVIVACSRGGSGSGPIWLCIESDLDEELWQRSEGHLGREGEKEGCSDDENGSKDRNERLSYQLS